MRLYLATTNRGKLREIQDYFSNFDVTIYSDIIDAFEIIEDGNSFKENAILKAKAVYKALKEPNAVVIADDSGISIEAFNGLPGIFSARYASDNASAFDNNKKVIDTLNEKNLSNSNAFYTTSIAITSKYGTNSVHGWMHGHVINKQKGNGGFGYDPIFIPLNYKQTLAELPSDVKLRISQRSQALQRLSYLIRFMKIN